MTNPISIEDLQNLYNEVEPLFPEDTIFKDGGMSGNSRVFRNGDFRIGHCCLLKNETNDHLVDVGFWVNYPTYHVHVTTEGLTLDKARLWFIDAAKHRIETENKEQARRKIQKQNMLKFSIAVIIILTFVVWLTFLL